MDTPRVAAGYLDNTFILIFVSAEKEEQKYKENRKRVITRRLTELKQLISQSPYPSLDGPNKMKKANWAG